ncbi:MAG: hypothetical protein QGH60_17985 [Phycisphaerae bacterium]|nr:hypothetical protein [Phycisphaerae bacterium]
MLGRRRACWYRDRILRTSSRVIVFIVGSRGVLGLISSTLLTLLVIPAVCGWFEGAQEEATITIDIARET